MASVDKSAIKRSSSLEDKNLDSVMFFESFSENLEYESGRGYKKVFGYAPIILISASKSAWSGAKREARQRTYR